MTKRARRKLVKVDVAAVRAAKKQDLIETAVVDILSNFPMGSLRIRFSVKTVRAYICIPRVHDVQPINTLARKFIYHATHAGTSLRNRKADPPSRVLHILGENPSDKLSEAFGDLWRRSRVTGTNTYWVGSFNSAIAEARKARSDDMLRPEIDATMARAIKAFTDLPRGPYMEPAALKDTIADLTAAINPPLKTANYLERYEGIGGDHNIYIVTKPFAVAGRHHKVGETLDFANAGAANRYLQGGVLTRVDNTQVTTDDVRNASTFLARKRVQHHAARRKAPDKPLSLSEIKAKAGITPRPKVPPKTIHSAETFTDTNDWNLNDD